MKRGRHLTEEERYLYDLFYTLAFPNCELISRKRNKNRRASRNWWRRNSLQQKEKSRLRKLADPAKAKMTTTHYRVRDAFGLSVEGYKSWMSSNGGMCHACDENTSKHLDHDHKTGQIRGALCLNCNFALGYTKDDIERLRRLMDYLLFTRDEYQSELYQNYLAAI